MDINHYMSRINTENLPTHIGIIMDGNGRWARSKGLPRPKGHKEGLKAAKRVVKACISIGIPYLSLYTFSTENWKRAKDEVSFLMALLKQYLKKEYDFYRQNEIKVVHSGDISKLEPEIQKLMYSVVQDTKDYTGATVNLAINYGGRNEIIRAVKHLIENGTDPDTITEKSLQACLDHPELPDPDLIIRTAGEFRLSNFLLWQSAYAEFYSSQTLWPDWDISELIGAIESYQKRKRKFGGLK